ncbi:MAG: NAD(P)H-hydrate dehydratase [Bacteroidales bacterium]|nr:NAD(P)H-hydrate dehydratase [Bacteroidales bacterium]
MKILSVQKIREADAYTILHESIADYDLMERAAGVMFEWCYKHIPSDKTISIICGTGNNGGDGLALGRMLAGKGYRITLYFIRFSDKISPSCSHNLSRIMQIREVATHEITAGSEVPDFAGTDIIVDALFGSGLSKPVTGLPAEIIDRINRSGAIVIAVDVPSGFFCDQTNQPHHKTIVRADYTLTLQFPKLGFMFPENDDFVGKWEVLPIGLHPEFIRDVEVTNYYTTLDEARGMIRRRKKFSHKGTYGHGLLISGSYGKMGAAVLGAAAAMRSGAGLITVHVPARGYDIVQTAVPEAMVSIDTDEMMTKNLPDLSRYSAVAAGPGIGTHHETALIIKRLIQDCSIPLIFDADALNILSENPTWTAFLRPGTIITPHPKEFERIAGRWGDDFERIQKQRELSIKYGIYIVLKGAHTSVTFPDGSCHFNSTGNPGMATGGSGDILTGILLGLMSQGYPAAQACLLSTFLHGLAGDMAAAHTGYEALTAGDLISHLGKAFLRVHAAEDSAENLTKS